MNYIRNITKYRNFVDFKFVTSIKTKDKSIVDITSDVILKNNKWRFLTQTRINNLKNHETIRNCIVNSISKKDFNNLLFHDDNTEEKVKKLVTKVYNEAGYEVIRYRIINTEIIEKGENLITSGSRGAIIKK